MNINYSTILYISILLHLSNLFPNFCLAQENIMQTNVSATLETILILNIDPDVELEFGIVEVGENVYQLTKHPEDVHFSVESTGNWNLSISATNNYFTSVDDSSYKIPVDFVGYYIENKGSNWDNGLFSDIANRTKDTTLSLSPKKTTVLVSGLKIILVVPIRMHSFFVGNSILKMT